MLGPNPPANAVFTAAEGGRGNNRERAECQEDGRGKGFKTKSQSGVQWHEAQREVTSEVVRGDCSRNPSDGRDHACLHAQDNNAARRRFLSSVPLFLVFLRFFFLFVFFFIFPFPSLPARCPPSRFCAQCHREEGRLGGGRGG